VLNRIFDETEYGGRETEYDEYQFGGSEKMGYLTIHEAQVPVQISQRRPGLHTEPPGIYREPGTLQIEQREVVCGWGGGHVDDFEDHNVLQGGIYMVSMVPASTEVWDCNIVDPKAIGPFGYVEHLRYCIEKRYAKSQTLDAGELLWMTDRTPHQSLPLGFCTPAELTPHEVLMVAGPDGVPMPVVRRQFVRIVAGEISVWYAQHSTPNPIAGMEARAQIIHGNKFKTRHEAIQGQVQNAH
jgi:hypothetical protein